MHVAERLRQEVAKERFAGEMSGLRLTISMGVATCPAEGISSVADLIREADEALYRAKQGGRNRVVSMYQK